MQLCRECVEEILKSFLENAKEQLKEEEFVPVALPLEFTEDDIDIKDAIPVIFEDDSDKISTLLDIGAACWFQDVEDVVLVLPGCGRKVDDMEKFIENYETEKPSLYPESMRDDYLMLVFLDLIDEDFKVLFCKYKRVDKEIVFEEASFEDSNKMQSGIVEFIVQGWNLMYRFLSDEDEESETEEKQKE